jgi:hypothetical protein
MQEILVFAIVAAAAFYVGKMLWDAVAGRKSGCNGCGKSCGSHAPATEAPSFPTRVGKAFLRAAPDGSAPDSAAPLVQIDLSGLSAHAKKAAPKN